MGQLEHKVALHQNPTRAELSAIIFGLESERKKFKQIGQECYDSIKAWKKEYPRPTTNFAEFKIWLPIYNQMKRHAYKMMHIALNALKPKCASCEQHKSSMLKIQQKAKPINIIYFCEDCQTPENMKRLPEFFANTA